MNCKDFSKYLDDYLENNLSEDISEMLEHINSCGKCRAEYEFAVKIIDTLHNMDKMEVPADFLEKLNKRIDSEKSLSVNINKNKFRRFISDWRGLTGIAAAVIFVAVITNINMPDIGVQKNYSELPENIPNNAVNNAVILEKSENKSISENQPETDINAFVVGSQSAANSDLPETDKSDITVNNNSRSAVSADNNSARGNMVSSEPENAADNAVNNEPRIINKADKMAETAGQIQKTKEIQTTETIMTEQKTGITENAPSVASAGNAAQSETTNISDNPSNTASAPVSGGKNSGNEKNDNEKNDNENKDKEKSDNAQSDNVPVFKTRMSDTSDGVNNTDNNNIGSENAAAPLSAQLYSEENSSQPESADSANTTNSIIAVNKNIAPSVGGSSRPASTSYSLEPSQYTLHTSQPEQAKKIINQYAQSSDGNKYTVSRTNLTVIYSKLSDSNIDYTVTENYNSGGDTVIITIKGTSKNRFEKGKSAE